MNLYDIHRINWAGVVAYSKSGGAGLISDDYLEENEEFFREILTDEITIGENPEAWNLAEEAHLLVGDCPPKRVFLEINERDDDLVIYSIA